MENDKNNTNENITVIHYLITLGTVSLFSSYFFTRGYIHSFSLPVKVDFIESGYFILGIISDRIFPIIFSIFTDIWFWIILLTISMILKIKFLKFDFFSKLKKIVFNWITPLRFLMLFMFSILFLRFVLNAESPKIFSWIDTPDPSVSPDTVMQTIMSKTYSILFYIQRAIMKWLYIIVYGFKSFVFLVVSIFTVFSIPVFIFIFADKQKNFFKKTTHFLIFLLIILTSTSSSYSLGKDYLSKFIHYPEYRTDIKTTQMKIQIWRDKNSYFYVECKEYGVSVIKGEDVNGKISYIGYLIRSRHPTVCR